ncbi:hypothetical protein ZWY2020_001487 [Hordeum vulgare]|nr:hypothetical protein ZWY2020_001487 [Hordeum vulgare]
MRNIDAALRKVAMVPRDKLDDNSKIWANDVRELSYEMEDVVESFLVGVAPVINPDSFKGFMKKAGILSRVDQASCANATVLDEALLIEKLQGLLANKRYIIIVDDIWDMGSWDIIKCAFIDSKCGKECTFMGSLQFSVKLEDSPYHLKHLGRLVHLSKGVLDWTNLTSLEELQLGEVTADFLKGLGKMKELREFDVLFYEYDDMLFKDLMERLVNLQKLQVIKVNCWYQDEPEPWSDYAGSVALGHLRHLALYGLLPGLPVWINSSCLPNLCHLHIELMAMESRDMEILGRFSELITLCIYCYDGVVFPDTMEEGAFPKLRYLELKNSKQPRFVRGAMSSLECFELTGLVGTNGLDFHSLVNLPRLQKVDAAIEDNTGMGSDVLQAALASLKHAVEIHPNHPALKIRNRQFHD